jgi:hypothetical protein
MVVRTMPIAQVIPRIPLGIRAEVLPTLRKQGSSLSAATPSLKDALRLCRGSGYDLIYEVSSASI